MMCLNGNDKSERARWKITNLDNGGTKIREDGGNAREN